jgi:PAS domain S-box-containing protein
MTGDRKAHEQGVERVDESRRLADSRISDVVRAIRPSNGERTEQELRRAEALFRLVEENVKEVIWTTDLGLRFTYLSPSELEMTGFTVEEALKLTAKDVLTPESLQRATQLLAREMAEELYGSPSPSRSVVVELDQYRKDGSTFPTEATITFLRDETGRPVGLLGVSRDVTERKQAEAMIAKQHDLALKLSAGSGLDEVCASALMQPSTLRGWRLAACTLWTGPPVV